MGFCSVKWCGKSSKNVNFKKDGITFHRFPKSPAMKEKWINATHRGESWFPSKMSSICSRHFTEDCFHSMTKQRRRLLSSAVPTLYLPLLTSHPSSTDVDHTQTTAVKLPEELDVGARTSPSTHLKVFKIFINRNMDNKKKSKQREKANARKRNFLDKMTPEQKELKRAKDREYYKKKKAEQKTKSIENMSEREKRQQRKQWKINSQKYRETKKTLKNILSNSPPDSENEGNDTPSRAKLGRKSVKKDRAKAYRTIKKQKVQISKMQQKIDSLRKTLLRMKKLAEREIEKKNASPNSKVTELARDCLVTPEVRKNLLFSEVLSSQLKENCDKLPKNSKEREVFQKCAVQNINPRKGAPISQSIDYDSSPCIKQEDDSISLLKTTSQQHNTILQTTDPLVGTALSQRIDYVGGTFISMQQEDNSTSQSSMVITTSQQHNTLLDSKNPAIGSPMSQIIVQDGGIFIKEEDDSSSQDSLLITISEEQDSMLDSTAAVTTDPISETIEQDGGRFMKQENDSSSQDPLLMTTSQQQSTMSHIPTDKTKRTRIRDPESPSAYDDPVQKRLCRRLMELKYKVEQKNVQLRKLRDSNRRLKRQVISLKSLLGDTKK